MKFSVPRTIGCNIWPDRMPGGHFPSIEDSAMVIETYSSYRQPGPNWKNADHRLIMEAGNRVLERRVEIDNVR